MDISVEAETTAMCIMTLILRVISLALIHSREQATENKYKDILRIYKN